MLFALHPEAYEGWRHLIKEVSRPMDPRRYELVTLAAANRLRSSYCSIEICAASAYTGRGGREADRETLAFVCVALMCL